MNTQTSTAPAEVKTPAPIVDAAKLTPVTPSGITNVATKAQDKDVKAFCNAIIKGLPTAKMFPTKLSEMEFTKEQRDAIAAARTLHRRNTRHAKAAILKTLKSPSILLTGHKTDHKGTKGRLGYVHKSIFERKTKESTIKAEQKYFGETVAAPAKPATTA